jgi:AraC family transcriptional regulator, positive regulator of tynA and feaB
VFRFSSDAVEPRDRFEFWVEAVKEHVVPVRVEPAEDCPFLGEIEMQMIGDLSIVNIAAAGQRAAWTRSEIARSTDHFVLTCLHLDGAVCVKTEDRGMGLRCGDVLLLNSLQEFRLGLEHPHRDLIVKFPRRWLEARVPRPDLLSSVVLPHDSPLVRLCAGYLAAGFKAADQLTPKAAIMFATHVVDLLAEAITDSQRSEPSASEAWRAAMFVRAGRLIALNVGDADFRPDQLAHQLGISTRTLHRIFAERDTTVMKHLLAERVGRAAKLLASPQARRRTVTEIAFACGFNDLSHFGRVFEAQMGMAPSQWRKSAPADGSQDR